MNSNPHSYRIAFILTPVDFGGAEQVSLNFLKHYRRDNIKITPILLCRPWETDNVFIQNLEKLGIDYRLIPTRSKPRELGRDYYRFVRCAKAMHKELKNKKFDLIHTNGYFADILGTITSKLLKIPIVTTCHGFISNDLKLSLYNKLDIVALRLMNRVVAVSEEIKSDLQARGINHSKIKVLQNAVNCTHDAEKTKNLRQKVRLQYNIPPDVALLGYVGRLSQEKGIKYFIESGSHLLKSDFQFRLLIIGDGPQRVEIEELAGKYNLRDKVIFAGFKKNVSDILPALDLFVLPSLTEGTSMALLEAMSIGLPVIATAVGGTPKVITSEKNGILIHPKNPEAISDAVKLLLSNKKLCEELGSAAAQMIAADYSIEKWLESFDELYTQVIDGSIGAPQQYLR